MKFSFAAIAFSSSVLSLSQAQPPDPPGLPGVTADGEECTCEATEETEPPTQPPVGETSGIVISRGDCDPNNAEQCAANCLNIHGVDDYLADKCCKHVGQSASLLAFEEAPEWVPRLLEFNRCTGANVRLEYLPEGEDGMADALRADLGDDVFHENLLEGRATSAAGQGIFDAYIVQAPWLWPVVNGLENLSPLIRENADTVQFLDINAASRSAVSYNGTVRALPLDTDYIALGWRQDVFFQHNIPPELSPPRTIQDLAKVAQQLNGKDFNKDGEGDWGVCLTPQVNYFYAFVAPLMQSALRDVQSDVQTGQNMFFDSETFKPFLRQPAFQEALELYWTIILNSNCQEQLAKGEKCDRKTAFPTGRCAMVISMPGTLTNMLLDGAKYAPRQRVDEETGAVLWDINNETVGEEGGYWGRRAPFPGSTIVTKWDAEEGYPLVGCQDDPAKYCPTSEREALDGRYINYAPFFAEGGEAYAINGRQSKPIARRVMWDLFTWLSELPVTDLPLSGQYRKSHLADEQRDDLTGRAGWSNQMVDDLFFVLGRYFRSQEEGGNPVQDLLMLGFPEYMDALDDELHVKFLGVSTASTGGLFDRSNPSQSINPITSPNTFQKAFDDFVDALEVRYNTISDSITGGQIGQLQRWRQSLNLPWRSNQELCQAAVGNPEAFRRLQCPSIVDDLESLCRLYPDEFEQYEENYCASFFEAPQEKNKMMIIALSVILPVAFIASIVAIVYYMDQKRKKADSMWMVKKEDLDFGRSPKLIGRGSFGMVFLAEYRGTKVAVKKVLPPTKKIGTVDPRASTSDVPSSSNEPGFNDEDPEMGLKSRGKNSHPGSGSKTSTYSVGATSRWFGSASIFPRRGFFYASSSGSAGPMVQNAKLRRLKADFIVEMRHLAKLRHPNITTTMGAVLTRGEEPMMVMEYMEHGSLYDAIRNETINLNSKEDILTIVQDIAHGLRFLHSANPEVIHGDLKSKNILIDSSFRAKIADFGLSAKNRAGARGTPYWMAPELLTKESTNTVMSDIYSFGILLYEVYSRENPYKGESYSAVIRDICDPAVCKRPPVPSLCPTNIATLMQSCWQDSPGARPTAQQVDLALQAEGTIQGRVVRIEEMNRQLLEKNKEISTEQAKQLGHFACMSHEIRTPLNCVIGISSLLEEDTNLDPSQKDSVKMIVSSGKLLRQVVDDVLDFSKFISGNAEIEVRRTDLQDTLATIISSMALFPATEKNKVTIRTFYGPLVPQFIETDGRRLQQIMYNLLSNAIKFSKLHGKVDLSVSVGSRYNASNQSEESKLDGNQRPGLRLKVKDYGQGIAKSEFSKLFEPFQQTESGKAQGKGGTGLGLPIVKQLVELLGGSISVDSKVGEWTEFSVQFPLSVPPADTKSLAPKLTNSYLWMVSDNENEIQHMRTISDHLQMRLRRFGSLKELEDEYEYSGAADRSCVVFIQDNLYDETIFDRICRKAKAKTFLVTFGPVGKIGRAQAHYMALAQVFAVVLMEEVSRIIHSKAPSKRISNKQDKDNQMSYEQLQILIAEDNVVNQKVITRLLSRLGAANVDIADNGQIACDLEKDKAFDIVFMDMQMPVMDGVEACKHIASRTDRTWEAPKIVFLSANVMDDHESLCNETGATDYLTKPCTLVDLRKMMEKLTKDKQEALNNRQVHVDGNLWNGGFVSEESKTNGVVTFAPKSPVSTPPPPPEAYQPTKQIRMDGSFVSSVGTSSGGSSS